MSEPHERFAQPVEAIRVVSRAGGFRTSLTPEALARGRARVDAGEDLGKVALDLAIEEAHNLYGGGEGET